LYFRFSYTHLPKGCDGWAPLALGDVLGRHDGKDRRRLLAVEVRGDGVADGGAEGADHDVHLLPLDEPASLGEPGGRLALGVLHDELHLATGQPVLVLFQEHLEGVHHVLAVRAERAGDRGQQPDLDRALALRPPAGPQDHQQRGDHHHGDRKRLSHLTALLSTLRFTATVPGSGT
jgi:hypothetical protein